MRILFVSLAPPFPLTNGHRLRTWALLHALIQEGHQVALITFADPGEVGAASPLRKLCERVEVLPAPRRVPVPGGDYLGRALALVSSLPFGAWRFQSAAMRKRVEQALATGRYDAILCDGVYNMPNIPAPSPPVLLNKDDIAHVIFERYLPLERNPLRKFYGYWELKKLRAWEPETCNQASGILVCCENDRSILEAQCPNAPIAVLPNVVDTEAYPVAGPGQSATLLYQGAMDWYPNRDAVEFFASAILPELRARIGDVRFRVLSPIPSPDFRARFANTPEVEFTGKVPDLREEIARAALCVVPLRIGSGTRFKIIEAAAMGKAIVSTRIGAEGLEFADGQEILLADDPRDFAEAVARLLADPARCREMGLAARRRAEQIYSLPVLRKTVRQALSRMVTHRFPAEEHPFPAPASVEVAR